MQSRRYCNRWPILLALHLWITGCANSTEIPRFADVSGTKTIFLGGNETWIPSSTTLITALMAGESFTIQTKASAVYVGSIVPDLCYLKYKCSAEDSDYQEIVLWNSKGSNSPGIGTQSRIGSHCSSAREFELKKVDDSSYTFKLLKNNISYERALKHTVELSLFTVVSNKALESASLFVFSIDSIVTKNSEYVTRGNYTYRKFMLTDDAINVLAGNHAIDVHNVTKVKFLEDDFLDLVKSAPALMRSLMSVTLTLVVSDPTDPGCSVMNKHAINLAVFDSSDLYTAQTKHFSRGHINLDTGMLLFKNDISSRQRRWFKNQLRVCLRISLNTNTWRHYVIEEVMAFKAPTMLPNDTSLNHGERICCINSDKAVIPLTLFAGVSNPAIASPIVCGLWKRELFVTFSGQLCTERWHAAHYQTFYYSAGSACGNFYLALNHESIIINGTVDPVRHAGILTLQVDHFKIRINVTVVSMPLFKTPSQDGSLPPETVATLDLSVPFKCSVFPSGIHNVRIWANFRKLDGNTWTDDTADEFATNRLHMTPGSIVMSIHPGATNYSLQLTLPRVTTRWMSWRLAYSCLSSVLRSEAIAVLGIPQYQTATTSVVRYFGERIQFSSNGDCQSIIASPDCILILVLSLWAIVGNLIC